MNCISKEKASNILVSCLRKAFFCLIIAMPSLADAQDFSSILKSIEANSARLESARIKDKAEKLDSKDLYTLEDPEVGFDYLFGAEGIGHRIGFEVSQGFDFPTVISQKRKMAKEMQRVSELKYLSERQQLLLNARKLCIQVVYCNAIMDHLDEDLEETTAMSKAYETLFDKGEATAIDRNKAHQAFLFFKTEYDEFHAMRENLLNELKCLNGGNAVEISDTAFVFSPLSNDFDGWLAQNIGLHPELQLAEGELQAEKQSLKVAKGSRIPGFKIGYTGEFTREEKYQGPTIGLSLPLWGSGRKVKVAKLHVEAAEKSLEDTRLHLTTQLRGVYREALQLQDTYLRYRKHLTECDNSELLKKSLDSGQITLLQYLQERQFVHEMHEKILIAERDLALRKAELLFNE